MTQNSHPPVFHQGEIAAQEKAGFPDFAQRVSASGFVREFMPDQHRSFFISLPMISAGLLDEDGRPWATVIFGEVGFITSPDPELLCSTSLPAMSEVLKLNITKGAKIGLCGVELETRRRNRMNGTLIENSHAPFTVKVDQSFGNCPQYIQKRELTWNKSQSNPLKPKRYERSPTLCAQSKSLIEKADTFFISSRAPVIDDDPRSGVDISHRGGNPGVVRVLGNTDLSFPDFSGNRFYNTIGNLETDSRVGLFFADFETGDVVMITGHASICWEDERIVAFDGAERIIDITVKESLYVPALLPISSKLIEPWPVLEVTGTWKQAQINMLKKDGYRKFEISRIQKESSVITSFYLVPSDGGPLEHYKPGQFLPIRLKVNDEEELVTRTYTLSQAPGKQSYRLSIKREPKGYVSQTFHDNLALGSQLDVGSPVGDFVLAESEQPIVMLSAGVGITPMIAMLEGLVQSVKNGAAIRKVWFVHGAVNSQTCAFKKYVNELQKEFSWLTVHTSFSAPLETDIVDSNVYDATGHVSINTLKALLPFDFDNYQFYMCGPEGFMRALYTGMRAMDICRTAIHYEFFGEGSLADDEQQESNISQTQPATAPVHFLKSNLQTTWTPDSASLLDLAEKNGLTPAQNCRSGKCGTCSTKLHSGSVYYPKKPVITPATGQVLICCCWPKIGSEEIVLEL